MIVVDYKVEKTYTGKNQTVSVGGWCCCCWCHCLGVGGNVCEDEDEL